jgi:hypothetical protein
MTIEPNSFNASRDPSAGLQILESLQPSRKGFGLNNRHHVHYITQIGL